MTKRNVALIFAMVLALAFIVGPTLLNSFDEKHPGWNFTPINPANPGQLMIGLSWAAAIVLLVLASRSLAEHVGKISAMLACSVVGAPVLAVALIGSIFFIDMGGQYAARSFADEWMVFMKYGFQGFVVSNVCVAIGASVLGLLLQKASSANPPAAPNDEAANYSPTKRNYRWNPLSWLRFKNAEAS